VGAVQELKGVDFGDDLGFGELGVIGEGEQVFPLAVLQ